MAAKAKAVKGVESYTVYKFDNGFTIEYSGYDETDTWVSFKLIVSDEQNLIDVIKSINAIPTSN